MTTQTQSLVGTSLDGYVLESLIGEGSFSWAYSAARPGENRRQAIKMAKPAELIKDIGAKRFGQTEALMFITGGVSGVIPDPVQLLALQSLKIQQSKDPALPSVDSIVTTADVCYCRMELLEGRTLRDVMKSGPVSTALLLELVQIVERLSTNSNFKFHGDLKPENIMVTPSGVRIVDPGYFGPLDCQEGNLEHCVVTTPAYYPLLAPDDLYALGFILWEVICRRHPLEAGAGFSEAADKSGVGDELFRFVRQRELVGQYFLTPILETGRPAEIRRGLPPGVEGLLLKALRLKITPENKIEKEMGFENFTALANGLRALMASGVTEL